MEKRELICVNCPKGCHVEVMLDDANQIQNISGYSCIKGKNYAAQEVIRPMRILTSTVRILHGTQRVLPVITSREIPLDMTDQAMDAIRSIKVAAPVKDGDVIIRDFLQTGADLIASRSMAAVQNQAGN